ncbi:FAD-binding protein [Kaistia dalseonensis]|uniref:D-lactate dehydrogenase (cytochrome) n=1 Tax=Kaistia dalseonensis TaxID=410840 RepID=A0ABU0HBV1_9HYPH|nr:FAD-linked oxidase C-terminal domain-containing protein [Kaistia dalseonensis]MCX5497114.1 FAD-binding protein [Kaistia dalseonensis]MDQ0439740.1 D-lactate dehydrogenase (cytochrome) [Kaistia dalseonensis]
MVVSTLRERSGLGSDGLAAVLGQLEARFGQRFSRGLEIRRQHANTTTWLPNEPADAVVYAASTDEVAEIVSLCARYGVPVIPFGTGTSLEGHVNAPFGGISLDLSQMNRIVAVHPEDLDCTVEAGVTRKQLNEYIRDQGLFFPIDPGADASLGGMAATRASGTNAVRYGTMRDNVINLTAVMADGTILKTASRAKKSSAGYDLTRLLIGSEGTLGVITEVTLRLQGIPEAIAAGICAFPTVEDACNATILTIQSGIPVARIELMDALMIRATNQFANLDMPETPHLFLEFHGSTASVAEQSEAFGAIARDFGGGDFTWATRPEDRSRLWQARHDSYFAAKGLRVGGASIATDVCVPISRLAECVAETVADIAESGLIAPIVGHVGDGNFHVQPLVDLNDAEEIERVEHFIGRLTERAIAMEGTCTGEHGVGQGKRKYLEKEHGAGVGIMRTIKAALDPLGIMNPGKILPDL